MPGPVIFGVVSCMDNPTRYGQWLERTIDLLIRRELNTGPMLVTLGVPEEPTVESCRRRGTKPEERLGRLEFDICPRERGGWAEPAPISVHWTDWMSTTVGGSEQQRFGANYLRGKRWC